MGRAKKRTQPAIRYGQGWNVGWWLGRLGRLPLVEAGQELLLEGLPPGTYEGALGGQAFRVQVAAGEAVLIEDP